MFIDIDQNTEPVFHADTRALQKGNSRLLQRLIDNNNHPGKTRPIGYAFEITFSIRGMLETFCFSDTRELTIGRLDPLVKSEVDVDLTPYGGHERGVSRLHAKIELAADCHLYITDLKSANGTYLAGQRLQPNQPYLLRDGDRLVVGSLPLQVFFK